MHIVERNQWGARAPRGSWEHTSWSPGGLLVLHHTASAPLRAGAAQPEEAAQVRAFQRQHQDVNGWVDIGYHFLVAPSGRVYRGRPAEVVGAHCPGWNHQPGVALIGNYDARDPSANQVEAVLALAQRLRSGRVVGHRDNYATSCPGDHAYRVLVEHHLERDLEVVWPPHGDTLELNVAGHPKFPLRGWPAAAGALRAIARDGLRPEPAGAGERHYIEWRGGRWEGARQVTGVARRLVREQLGEEVA